MSRAFDGRLPRVVLAAVAVLAMLLAPVAATPVAAAEDGLSLVSTSTYTLIPEKSLVHVSVALTAKNNKPDLVRETSSGTITTRYFFESASIAVQSEATAIQAKAGTTTLATTLTPDDGFALLRVEFPSDLYFGQTVTVTVDYDLPGGLPRSDSDIRVGSAFATFYAWAFGDSGDVKILVPGTYDVEASGSPTHQSTEGTANAITATGISDVTDWYTIVVADRHDALTQERLDLADGEHLVIRAWPEDEEWRTRVSGLLEIGLPVLVDKLALDWPVEGDIEVAEVHTPLLEGYAGVFYTNENRIEISEDLDELTIIHEAAHAWFNDNLFVGRWITEGLADEYASLVLDEVSNGGLGPEFVSSLSPGAVPLNAWARPGRIDDEETDAREHYGYEASWSVVREIVQEVGEDGMRKVLAAADVNQTAYVGAGTPETINYPNDWRRFLDLLEEQGGANDAVTHFRQTVVTDEEKPLLEERAEARRAYVDLIDASDGWLPGYAVRDPMGRWQFDRANDAMEDATGVLELRGDVEAAATELGLTLPTTLQDAYEGAADDFDDARALAERQLTTMAEIESAGEQVAAERGALTVIGLIGEDPEAAVQRAEGAFEAGDLDATDTELDAADAQLTGAAEAGRERLVAGGVAAAGAVAIGAGMFVGVRRWRRRSPMVTAPADAAPAPEGPPGPVDAAPAPEAAEPYATLGDPPPTAAAPDEPDGVGRERGDGT